MAKTLIRNIFDNTNFSFFVPADDTAAGAFAAGALDGAYEIYAQESVNGSDIVPSGQKATVSMRQVDANGDTVQTSYASFYVNSTASENDLPGVLAGQTIEGVKADEVGVRLTSVSFS